MGTRKVSAASARKPGSMLIRRSKLRSMRPAPVRRMRLRAVSATTRKAHATAHTAADRARLRANPRSGCRGLPAGRGRGQKTIPETREMASVNQKTWAVQAGLVEARNRDAVREQGGQRVRAPGAEE